MSAVSLHSRTSTISQAQIARAIGVSQAAVSQALNNTGRISPQARRRIREMCQRLHYRPNALARSLRKPKSRFVGVACGSPTDSFEAALLGELERELHRRGYQMLMRTMLGSKEQAWEYALQFVDHRVCGVIFAMPFSDLQSQLMEAFPGAFAAVTIGLTQPGMAGVGCDYDRAGHAVAEHLLALGRRRWAANITAPQFTHDIRPKTRAFAAAALATGLSAPLEVTLTDPHFDTRLDEAGWVMARAVLDRRPDTDAFFFSCDDIALGAIAYLRHVGKRVPEDVAVVGFNDSPAARFSPIPLTTIRQPVERYAREAARMLDEQLENPEGFVPQPLPIECPLIVRGTTDARYTPQVPDVPAAHIHFGPTTN